MGKRVRNPQIHEIPEIWLCCSCSSRSSGRRIISWKSNAASLKNCNRSRSVFYWKCAEVLIVVFVFWGGKMVPTEQTQHTHLNEFSGWGLVYWGFKTTPYCNPPQIERCFPVKVTWKSEKHRTYQKITCCGVNVSPIFQGKPTQQNMCLFVVFVVDFVLWVLSLCVFVNGNLRVCQPGSPEEIAGRIEVLLTTIKGLWSLLSHFGPWNKRWKP